MKKKILFGLLTVLLLAAIAFFGFGPGYFDKSMNKVTSAPTVGSFPEYDSLPFVADLHCDMLLWDRNFFDQHEHGHVDLPRMQSANMAFQAFTIVSKTPRNMNIESNRGDTDQIALLSFVQL